MLSASHPNQGSNNGCGLTQPSRITTLQPAFLCALHIHSPPLAIPIDQLWAVERVADAGGTNRNHRPGWTEKASAQWSMIGRYRAGSPNLPSGSRAYPAIWDTPRPDLYSAHLGRPSKRLCPARQAVRQEEWPSAAPLCPYSARFLSTSFAAIEDGSPCENEPAQDGHTRHDGGDRVTQQYGGPDGTSEGGEIRRDVVDGGDETLVHDMGDSYEDTTREGHGKENVHHGRSLAENP